MTIEVLNKEDGFGGVSYENLRDSNTYVGMWLCFRCYLLSNKMATKNLSQESMLLIVTKGVKDVHPNHSPNYYMCQEDHPYQNGPHSTRQLYILSVLICCMRGRKVCTPLFVVYLRIVCGWCTFASVLSFLRTFTNG